jgi:autotransporter adhesin
MTQAITAAIAAIPPGGSGGGQGGQGTGVAPADIADMVEYDGPSRDKLTLQGGPAGTTIANVRAGAVGASSTEAINGSQLFATNQQVAQINTTVQNIDSSVSAIKQDVTTLKQNITDIQTSVTDLFDLRDQDRKDMKQGVASAMSMASAPVPSDVGMFSYAINGARFRGEYAVGASFMYRLNTEAPVAIGMGVSYAGNKNNGVRIGISGEF